jgi:hypothetical protein
LLHHPVQFRATIRHYKSLPIVTKVCVSERGRTTT